MIVFGQTSLFVYWIHVEIVYGFATYPLRHELSLLEWLVAYLCFTSLMLGVAMLWQRRQKSPLVPEFLRVTSASTQH